MKLKGAEKVISRMEWLDRVMKQGGYPPYNNYKKQAFCCARKAKVISIKRHLIVPF